MAPAVQGGEVLAHSGRLIAAIHIQQRRDVRQLNAKASEDQDLLQALDVRWAIYAVAVFTPRRH